MGCFYESNEIKREVTELACNSNDKGSKLAMIYPVLHILHLVGVLLKSRTLQRNMSHKLKTLELTVFDLL